MLLEVSRDTSLENAVFHFIEEKEGKRISRPNVHCDYSSSLFGVRLQTPLLPETRGSSITCAESCGCGQHSSPCGRKNMRANSAERCSFASCRAASFIETVCMGTASSRHTDMIANKDNHRLPAQPCPHTWTEAFKAQALTEEMQRNTHPLCVRPKKRC